MLVRAQYEQLVYTLPARYSSIRLNMLVLVPPGLDTARLTGLVTFDDDLVLCVYELLNFQQGVMEAYRYEVSRCHPPFIESPLPLAAEYCRAGYTGKEKLYWYHGFLIKTSVCKVAAVGYTERDNQCQLEVADVPQITVTTNECRESRIFYRGPAQPDRSSRQSG